jgi:hypothetical protein
MVTLRKTRPTTTPSSTSFAAWVEINVRETRAALERQMKPASANPPVADPISDDEAHWWRVAHLWGC